MIPPRKVGLRFERLRRDSKGCLQLKRIGGRFYVHRVTSERGDGGRVVKISEHVGAITADGVFVGKKTAGHVRESKREVYEYGNAALAHSLLSDAESILKEAGDVPCYRELIACALIRAIAPSPIRLLESRWERFHLSRTMRVNLSPGHVSDVLRDAGRHVTWWYRLFSKLSSEGGLLLYDLTTIFAYSGSIKLAEKGYNPDHRYIDQIGVVMAFSCKDALPVGADVFYGSVKDISTIRDFLERLPDEAREKGVGFILDRGFTSYELLEDFRKEGIGYIVPLKKNSKLLKMDEVGWRDAPFLYRKRPVRWASMESPPYGRLYVFEDPEFRGVEEAALLRRVERKEFEERRRVAGVIGMLSDMEVSGPKMYDLYKGREDVELTFDATLDADRTYLQSPDGVRGFFLVMFLAMRVYFKILKRRRERKLTSRVSVEEVLFELSKVERIVEKNGREYYASIPKKARNMLSLFSDMMRMG